VILASLVVWPTYRSSRVPAEGVAPCDSAASAEDESIDACLEWPPNDDLPREMGEPRCALGDLDAVLAWEEDLVSIDVGIL
jgi:hypothetical protein